jgi:YfiH family protein
VLRFTQGQLAYYQFERLAAQPGLIHGVFTRHGGISPAPWASLNLSHATGDSVENVAENTTRMLAALGVPPEQTVSAWLNHGVSVAIVDAQDGGATLRGMDGLLTAEPDVFLSMRFADCAPLVLWDAAHGVLGLVHAGWPGVAAQIVTAALEAMARSFDSQPSQVWAGIGPAIRACCYQFGAELAQKIVAACPPGAPIIVPQPDGSLHLDLPAAISAQLHSAGVTDIEDAGLCTACRVDEWFSHRVEKKTGRFGLVIGRRARCGEGP